MYLITTSLYNYSRIYNYCTGGGVLQRKEQVEIIDWSSQLPGTHFHGSTVPGNSKQEVRGKWDNKIQERAEEANLNESPANAYIQYTYYTNFSLIVHLKIVFIPYYSLLN